MSDVFRVFDNMQDVVLVLDGEFGLRYGNEAAALLLDVSARRLSSGKPLSGFLEFPSGLIEEGQALAAIDAPTQTREIRFTTSGGKEGWSQVSIQSLPSALTAAAEQDGPRWLVYLRDVTLEKNLHDKYKAELDQKEAVIEDLRKARNELENYSKNLEKMVEARTAELRDANRLLATILDSLGQGIFVFNSAGVCLPVYSKVCLSLFGASPDGRSVVDVLGLEGAERETFQKWMEAVFSEMLSFEDLAPLAPSRLNSTANDRHVALNFNPMRGDGSSLQGVVLVATDKSAEMRARQEAERERSFARRVVQVVRHRQQFRVFAVEALRLCDELAASVAMSVEERRGFDFEETARRLHTIKGGAASFSLNEIAETAHACEDRLMAHKKTASESASSNTLMSADLSQELLSGVETMRRSLQEFLENHSFLIGGSLERTDRLVEVPVPVLRQWQTRLQEKPSASVETGQEILEDWILEPVERSFEHVNGSLQELAGTLGKRLLPLEIQSADVRVLPEAFSELFPTFIHAFRNAVDHGIETPEERVASGKTPEGKIVLSFQRAGEDGHQKLRIDIRDDGKGIDPQRIRARLIEKGLPFDAQSSDEQIIQAVFRDDFSTASQVTSVSGRGVGLSAIKEQAERMGGTCSVSSQKGSGSLLTVIVPDPSHANAPDALRRVG